MTKAAVFLALIAQAWLMTGCAGKPPARPAEMGNFDEFERQVEVEAATPPKATPQASKKTKARRALAKNKKAALAPVPATKATRQPAMAPRRPNRELYPTGEHSVFTVKMGGVSAGEMTLTTHEQATVNGRRAYHFSASLATNKFFSVFFKLRESIHLYFDYESLLPLRTEISLLENKKLAEVRGLFDWSKMRAEEWEKTIEGNGPLQERRKAWTLGPLSQNLFSVIYFLRAHDFPENGLITFPISHDEKNFSFKARVLRREILDTPAGRFNTVVIRATENFMKLFAPSARGDVFMWLTDDERRLLVKLETRLKVGNLSGILKELKL